MTVIGKLYGPLNNFRVQKIKLVAEITDLKLEYTPEFELFKTNQNEEFLIKFPLGKSPAFETPEGLKLTESTAISHYIASLSPSTNLLLPESPLNASKILQFILFSETSLITPAMNQVLRKYSYIPENPSADEIDHKTLVKSLAYLNEELNGKQYLVGDRLTLADIAVFADLIYPFKYLIDSEARKNYPNVINYFEHLFKLEAFTKVFEKLEYLD
ncbi:glutathione S-transferase [Conidiobolus coronatus NRRL 28638]|uniref:Glutathione S-transferase n=1 Tax=Conidiobolus coronatus (strain ATCC 28846 / CBS 209.66 / NRRL 28638) TaxID=796925 RepID=A0A137NUK0_CONC2|nr:glutathione S-transferase [Conidiobolus coronatus NRRL 28638]|eukprot:KXN66483.1 glutathione S-transferase [Conidiobolus coronatus NRRL 28638]